MTSGTAVDGLVTSGDGNGPSGDEWDGSGRSGNEWDGSGWFGDEWDGNGPSRD